VWAAPDSASPDAVVKWTESLSTYISLGVAACTCVTLVFLYRQTRCQTGQTRHIAEQTELLNETGRAELYQNVMKEMQEISRIFLQAPELRCYFYEGSPPPREGDRSARVEIMSEMIVDFMGFTLNTFKLFSAEEKRGWTSYFEDIGRNSPAIRAFWRAHREWYEPPVRNVLDPIVAEISDDPRPEPLASAS